MTRWRKHSAIFAVIFSFLLLPLRAQITHPNEVSALRAISKSLVDPFDRLKSWDTGDPCTSSWTGVLCFNTTKSDGYLHVQELQLLHMNLSGTLTPFVDQLAYMEILDVMWNNITGTIPKEIGNIKTLRLLLLNGNHLTGPLPEEIGFLPNLDRIQIDQNQISGPIPTSFANLSKAKHFHMNNNSLSGQIPVELSRLPNLVHLLLDNNNLSGNLPPELYLLPNLLILQLDNNQFTGAQIPLSYSNMSKLLKLSLRNCSLEGTVPDFSSITELGYLDLSWNHLTGTISTNQLSANITTIDLSNNNLTGTIPQNFSGLSRLQRLSLENNQLNGSISATLWQNRTYGSDDHLILDLQNNLLSSITATLNPPTNVSLWLQGNPLCTNASQLNVKQFCAFNGSGVYSGNAHNSSTICPIQSCPIEDSFEYVPFSPISCFCSAPIKVGYRLKSPGFSDFPPYLALFEDYLTSGLELDLYQLYIDTFIWEKGPRLRMYLKLFPVIKNSSSSKIFNVSEILRLRKMFTEWTIPDSHIFGPYEVLNFTLEGPYGNVVFPSPSRGMSKGILAAIILGAIAFLVSVSSLIVVLCIRWHGRHHNAVSKKHLSSSILIKVDGLKDFTFEELALATNNFNDSAIVGQGGYGKVYRGILADGCVVAIKRAQAGSLQGEQEFFTEIELLSRLHHRNLVSLIGYCNEEGEQMLVYDFMSNGTVRDHLAVKAKDPPKFALRLHIALGAARGIRYLHNEANPPIFHRDIKASNILLDSKFIAKVADFGLSRLAPIPAQEGIEPGHVSTVVKGTPGYLDPEYFLTHKLTDKSDVYSLGVVFLELLTGMHPISHGKNIVREVKNAFQSGLLPNIIDSRMGSYPFQCVEHFVGLAIRCCQDETDQRPTISEVVRELENICQKMPQAEETPSESMQSEIQVIASPSASSITRSRNTFESTDVSGNNLKSEM